MPTPVSELQARYQSLVAPGNNALFWRLLTEANERLLFAGRWHWAREPLSLTVSNGLVTLPDAYHSIVGARISGKAVGVNWQESEWFEGGPGEFIPIEGARNFLVDQGLVEQAGTARLTVAGSLTDGSNPVVFPELIRTQAYEFPSGFAGNATYFTDDGETTVGMLPPASGAWYACGVAYFTAPVVANGANLSYYLDGSLVAEWLVTNLDPGITDPADVDWSNSAQGAATGEPAFILVGPTMARTYKLTAENDEVTSVDVLARLKPLPITSCNDSLLCPLHSAIKQMLYSIVYEEANNTELSEQYRAKAVRELSEYESAYRGTAKRIYKPSMFRPVRRFSRSNFP